LAVIWSVPVTVAAWLAPTVTFTPVPVTWAEPEITVTDVGVFVSPAAMSYWPGVVICTVPRGVLTVTLWPCGSCGSAMNTSPCASVPVNWVSSSPTTSSSVASFSTKWSSPISMVALACGSVQKPSPVVTGAFSVAEIQSVWPAACVLTVPEMAERRPAWAGGSPAGAGAGSSGTGWAHAGAEPRDRLRDRLVVASNRLSGMSRDRSCIVKTLHPSRPGAMSRRSAVSIRSPQPWRKRGVTGNAA
jgi:hypothetical protein